MGTIWSLSRDRTADTGFRPSAGLSSASGLFTAVMDRLLTWQERVKQRAALASLDPSLLKDIGLSASEVQRELDKPFWRA